MRAITPSTPRLSIKVQTVILFLLYQKLFPLSSIISGGLDMHLSIVHNFLLSSNIQLELCVVQHRRDLAVFMVRKVQSVEAVNE